MPDLAQAPVEQDSTTEPNTLVHIVCYRPSGGTCGGPHADGTVTSLCGITDEPGGIGERERSCAVCIEMERTALAHVCPRDGRTCPGSNRAG